MWIVDIQLVFLFLSLHIFVFQFFSPRMNLKRAQLFNTISSNRTNGNKSNYIEYRQYRCRCIHIWNHYDFFSSFSINSFFLIKLQLQKIINSWISFLYFLSFLIVLMILIDGSPSFRKKEIQTMLQLHDILSRCVFFFSFIFYTLVFFILVIHS